MKVINICVLLCFSWVVQAQITYVETDIDVDKYKALRSIAIAPDGKYVYAGAASSDAIIIFSRNSTTGALTFSESVTASGTKLDNIYGVAVSKDGNNLYCVSINGDYIMNWTVDTSTGELTESQALLNGTNSITDMESPVNLIVSDDDKNVYVSSQTDDAIVVFDRNTSTGALTFKESLTNGSDGVTNMDNPRMLALSPSGDQLYTAAQSSESVVVFDRNTTTGALTFNESHVDNTGSTSLLDTPHGIAVSPDGKYVFVGSRGEDAITVFTRNASNGKLTFAFDYEEVADDIDELTDPMYIMVQSDSDELYVAGGSADAALVFSIDTSTGELTLVEEEKDGAGGIASDALNNVHYGQISPDGKHVYFASQAGQGITTFSVDNPPASAPTSATVAVTALLEGAWNGSSAMNTTLEAADLVAASDPYGGINSHTATASVASAAAVPDGVVDWVLVELREAGSAAAANDATRVGSAAGFLKSDGSIVDTDGSSNLSISLSGNSGSSFYVVVYHRNHLPIMSLAAVSESGGVYTIDLSASANVYEAVNAVATLSGGGSKVGMHAGDIDQDGNIDDDDLSTWRSSNGATYAYGVSGKADFNLDGVINAVDRNDFHQKNTSKTRQVPNS